MSRGKSECETMLNLMTFYSNNINKKEKYEMNIELKST